MVLTCSRLNTASARIFTVQAFHAGSKVTMPYSFKQSANAIVHWLPDRKWS
jgi:hypothetical protein